MISICFSNFRRPLSVVSPLLLLTAFFVSSSLSIHVWAQPLSQPDDEARQPTRAWGATLFGPPKSLIVGPRYSFTKLGGVVYKQGADYQLKCDVFMPDGPGPFPAVVAVHGGSWRTGSKLQMARHAWLMAQSGYVVVAINYRHAPKYRFPAQLQDIKHAVRWMRANAETYKIDPDQIAGFGYSAGGHMVSLLALQPDNQSFDCPDSDLEQYDASLCAVIAGGAPCGFDWVDEDSFLLKYLFGGTRREKPAAYRAASPIYFANSQSPPFYFFHGQLDFIVPPSSSRKLHRRLLSLGIESQYDVVEDSEHFLPFSRLEYLHRGLLFLQRHIKPPAGDDRSNSTAAEASPATQLGIE